MGRFSLMTLVCMLAGSSAFAADVMPANVVFNDGAISAALTAQAGDPAAGRKVFMNRKLGNCLACHANEDMSDQSFHGEVGPALDGVADRWEAAELRGIVVNSKMMFEGTIMPAFYKDGGFERNLKKFQGKSILNAQQVEDVVAYLLTLKEE
ncbi:MAG: sulfur oxidation c-type cytochrome SoxX [Paracoccaceae bacterium]|jgi:sulfur-oxidizing protein SoxX